jgi:hypothetical protein
VYTGSIPVVAFRAAAQRLARLVRPPPLLRVRVDVEPLRRPALALPADVPAPRGRLRAA